MTDLAGIREKVQAALEPAATDDGCPHCRGGHAPTWQAHSREWVHRRLGAQFSITICRKPPPPPA